MATALDGQEAASGGSAIGLSGLSWSLMRDIEASE